MINKITKKDGSVVPFDADKLNKWAEWAADLGADWSSIVLEATRKCYDGCTTQELHAALISACEDKETPVYQRMAGRLYIGRVYKVAFGHWSKIPTVKEMYTKMQGLGLWDKMGYYADELEYFQSIIDHSKDLKAFLPEVKQAVEKYAISDKKTKQVFESPQFIYMRMAMGNMVNQPLDRRKEDVAKLYKYLSEKKINPPSPFTLNLGTPKRHYASCCVFTTDDTIASLAAADHIAYIMTGASAGIGSHLKTRSAGDKVRGGAITHLGKIPYYKVQEAVVGANMQAARGGANTMHFTVLDPEFNDLIKLKNIESLADKRILGLDYSVGYNNEFARRVASNEGWMLVSYGDAPKLHEALYGPSSAFVEEYKRVEADASIPKKLLTPKETRELALTFLAEAVSTGRVYEHNTEELNRHTPFNDTIYSSNLCQEISLPTAGFINAGELYKQDAYVNGEIGLCSIAAIAAGLVESDEDYEDVAYYTCLMIDNVMTMMDYPFPALRVSATARRSIAVGITNMAYALAKNGLKYSSLEGKQFVFSHGEKHSFFLHKAAVKLASEKGVAEWSHWTKYKDGGWLPIDTMNKNIVEKLKQPLKYDWEALRNDIKFIGGLRFSVLEAHMPCESSAVASGHTNGLYPIRGTKILKTSGTNKNLFIAPEYDKLKDKYELAADISWEDLTDVYAAVQCFTGQAISADYYINYVAEDERKVSGKKLLQDWLYRVKMGLKTRYYINSLTVGDQKTGEEEDDCEACSL